MNKHSGIILSQADSRPLYLQVMEQVKRLVATGHWLPGEEIPSIRALAAELAVSVITIKRAYLELEREGIIATRQGKGSFVDDNPNLQPKIQQKELANHLHRAAELAGVLGLTEKGFLEKAKEAYAKQKEAEKK